MRERPVRAGMTATAVAVHDVALLIAVFYSPVLWGEFNTSGQAFVAGCVGVAAAAALTARWGLGRGPAVIPNAIHLPAAVFLLVSAAASMFSASRHASGIELTRLTTGALIFLLAANRALLPAPRKKLVAGLFACSLLMTPWIRITGEVGLALDVMCAVGVGLVCLVLVTEQEEPDPVRWWRLALVAAAAFVVASYGLREKLFALTVLKDAGWGVFSTFFNPNPLGGFLAMMLPLALSAVMAASRRWERMVWGAGALLLAVGILPTYSKGAMMAMAAATGLFLVLAAWVSSRRARNLGLVAGFFALVLVGAGLALWRLPAVRAQVMGPLSLSSASNMFRMLTWKGTLSMTGDHWWLGVGPGAFKHAYMKYAIGGYTEAAHQNYLQIAAEQGVFGIAAFLWLVGAVFHTAGGVLKRAEGFRERVVAAGLIGSLTALLVHSLLDYDWYIGAFGTAFWLVAGAAAHQAHGRSLLRIEAAPEAAPRGRRRRARQKAAPVAVAEAETGARRLPWPGSGGGQVLAYLGVGAALVLCVAVPARNALARKVLAEADTVVGLARKALAQRDMERAARDRDWALTLYARATRYDPGWAEAWERYGLMYGMARSLEEGTEALERAGRAEPLNYKSWLALAQLYVEKGKLEEAIGAFREAEKRFPNHTRTLRLMAETYQRLGQEEEALRVYRRMLEVESSSYAKYAALSIDVDTEYAYAHYQLGRAAARRYDLSNDRKDRREARTELRGAAKLLRGYFKGEARWTDQLLVELNRPRIYRVPELRRLEAMAQWRMADLNEKAGLTEWAERRRKWARSMFPEVESAIAMEDGGSPE